MICEMNNVTCNIKQMQWLTVSKGKDWLNKTPCFSKSVVKTKTIFSRQLR